MTGRQAGEGEVEGLICRVQHEISSIGQRGEVTDQRHCAGPEVDIERPGRIASDIEAAVDDRPGAGRRDGTQDLDAEQRRDDELGSGLAHHAGDRARGLGRPRGHALLHDRACGDEVTARRGHTFTDGCDQPGTEIELGGERPNLDAERRQRPLHALVADEQRFVTAIAQRQRSRDERLQIPAGAGGRDDQCPTHRGVRSECSTALASVERPMGS